MYMCVCVCVCVENIRVNAGNGISEDSRVITQGVRQGCPLSPVLLSTDRDKICTLLSMTFLSCSSVHRTFAVL